MAESGGRRLTVIGGGVMGLMTAYYAAPFAETVTVLERTRVGDPETASFCLTRSVRNDYLDPEYSRLAYESRRLWLELQALSSEPLLIDCGCLNLFKDSITPDLTSSYAVRSFAILAQLQLRRAALSAAELRQRFPQFTADAGRLDVDAVAISGGKVFCEYVRFVSFQERRQKIGVDFLGSPPDIAAPQKCGLVANIF